MFGEYRCFLNVGWVEYNTIFEPMLDLMLVDGRLAFYEALGVWTGPVTSVVYAESATRC